MVTAYNAVGLSCEDLCRRFRGNYFVTSYRIIRRVESSFVELFARSTRIARGCEAKEDTEQELKRSVVELFTKLL